MDSAVRESTVPVEFDFYDRLLELETCAKVWALRKRRLAGEPDNVRVREALGRMEDILLQAVDELPLRH